jgi:hypothetical protein
LIIAVLLAGGACSQGPEDEGPDSACVRLDGTCLAYTMTTPAQLTTLDDECTDDGGQLVPSCSNDGLVGVCTLAVDETSPAQARAFYYKGNAETLASACVSSDGSWATAL